MARGRSAAPMGPRSPSLSRKLGGGHALEVGVPNVPSLRPAQRPPPLRDVPAEPDVRKRVPGGGPVRSALAPSWAPLASPAPIGPGFLGMVRESSERRDAPRPHPRGARLLPSEAVPVGTFPAVLAERGSPRPRAPRHVRRALLLMVPSLLRSGRSNRHREPDAARSYRARRTVPLLQRDAGAWRRPKTAPTGQDRGSPASDARGGGRPRTPSRPPRLLSGAPGVRHGTARRPPRGRVGPFPEGAVGRWVSLTVRRPGETLGGNGAIVGRGRELPRPRRSGANSRSNGDVGPLVSEVRTPLA